MNTHKNAVRILCYGDSNTWGYIPGTGERYPIVQRWTGLLQKSLGENFEIIEEGLNSRTTVLDDPKNEGKNGATYLKPCLQTHYPLDLVILMLGTNDLKERFARTSQQITDGIETLIQIINDPEYNYEVKPDILLLTPPLVDESVNKVKEKYLGAEHKSKQLPVLYRSVAKKYHINFIDTTKIISPSKIDGYHLDPQSHQKLADKLTTEMKKIFTANLR